MQISSLEKRHVLIAVECHRVLTLGALSMLLDLSLQKKEVHHTTTFCMFYFQHRKKRVEFGERCKDPQHV